MLQALWPMIVNLAVTTASLRWFFRRQPRLRPLAGMLRWTVVLLGLGLAVHAAIDKRSNHMFLEILGFAGLALALNFLLFPGTAGRLLRRFQ
ncbi:MAG TPA: hypothetical protein VKL40_15720 [Candidatus Angelobacter sp.]|nr:hypothetical protein [Candidatus Angelobacter sp.]